jgi:hypothetical protein
MSDTPRTDAEILWMPDCVPAHFARTLEHELSAAKADIRKLKELYRGASEREIKYAQEGHSLRAELRSKLASAACFAIVTERQGKYPGAYQVADAVLDDQCDPPTDEITHLRVSLEHVASGLAAAEMRRDIARSRNDVEQMQHEINMLASRAEKAEVELARLTTLRPISSLPPSVQCLRWTQSRTGQHWMLVDKHDWHDFWTPLPNVKEAK